MIEFAQVIGWTEEMQAWEWNPLMTMLAIHHDRVVGFIAGWAGQPVGMIDCLVVHPDLRGQGIGVALWNAMTRHLFTLGAHRVRYLTDNPGLEEMLTRCGYQAVTHGAIMEGGR